MGASLTWRHHTLIQSLLSRGPLKEDLFHSIFSSLTGKLPGDHPNLFNDYLLKINKELSYVQFELRACTNQYDGNVYYGVVNNIADEHSKLGTKYTVPQIAFYKGIIEAIVQDATAEGSISNISALNIRLDNQPNTESQGGSSQVPAALRNFSMSQKEKTLHEFVQDQWLCSTSNGNVGLGVRSFLDLRSWLRSNNVPACDVCNEAGVKADQCQNEGCDVRIHKYCLKKKFSQRKVKRVCPGCGAQWDYQMTKEEAVEIEEPNEPIQRQPLPTWSTRKRSRICKAEVVVDTLRAGPSQTTEQTMTTRRKSSRMR